MGYARRALPADVGEVVYLGSRFITESSVPGTFVTTRTADTVRRMVDNAAGLPVVYQARNEIAGFAYTEFAAPFTIEPWAYLQFFYIRPEHRGSEAARGLVQYIVAECDERGCSMIAVSSGAGIGSVNDRLFANLFRKFGFRELGSQLVR